MFAQTTGGLVTTPSAVYHHLGIDSQHPEILAAKDLFYSRRQKSLLLILDREDDGNLPVVRITMAPTINFLESDAHTAVIDRLTWSVKGPVTDREIFTTALYNLLLRYVKPIQVVSGSEPQGVFQKACFDLLFAYTPTTYCIAATLVKSLDQKHTQLRYSKIATLD